MRWRKSCRLAFLLFLYSQFASAQINPTPSLQSELPTERRETQSKEQKPNAGSGVLP